MVFPLDTIWINGEKPFDCNFLSEASAFFFEEKAPVCTKKRVLVIETVFILSFDLVIDFVVFFWGLEVAFVFRVNSLFSATAQWNLVYDDDINIRDRNGNFGPRTQFKSVLGIGISYKLEN